MIITITDIRLAGYCPKGAKQWADLHGIDFRDFLKNGIDADVLLATGDAFVNHVVERKIARETE